MYFYRMPFSLKKKHPATRIEYIQIVPVHAYKTEKFLTAQI